jgi:hypothetical protein
MEKYPQNMGRVRRQIWEGSSWKNFRLKTGHDCLAAHLRKIGIHESSEGTICQVSNFTMDEEHLPYFPKLDTHQQMLKTQSKSSGMPER